MMTPIQIENAFSEMAENVEANAVEKGFRRAGRVDDREAVAVFVSNEHSEVSELWEAYRAGKLHEPCDKSAKMETLGIGPLTSAEEELADIIIRALDTARALGINNIGRAVLRKHAYNTTRPKLHGGKLA